MTHSSSQQAVLDAAESTSGEDWAPDTGTNFYTDGQYLTNNPTWHVEDGRWKAEHVLDVIRRHDLTPRTICEVGCGAGEILVQLKANLPQACEFWGYDLSPDAYALAMTRADDRLHFRQADLLDESANTVDLVLVMDLIEHLEDYYGFLKDLRSRGELKIFHIPLDLSAYTVLTSRPILYLRKSVGHIHYFSCDTALAALRDTGYEIIDWFYPPDTDPLRGRPFKQKTLEVLRRGLSKLAPNFAVRLLGGRSLMVLAR